jgi:hypothetical protein
LVVKALKQQLVKAIANKRRLASAARANRAAVRRYRRGASGRAVGSRKYEFETEFEAEGGDTSLLDEMEYYAALAAEAESEAEADEFFGALASLAGPLISSLIGEDEYEDEGDPFFGAILPIISSVAPAVIRGVGKLFRGRRKRRRIRRRVPTSRRRMPRRRPRRIPTTRGRRRRVIRPRYCVL